MVCTDESVACTGSQIHAFACSGSYTDVGELLGQSVPALEGASLHSPGVRHACTFTLAPVISLHLAAQVCLCPGSFALGRIWVVRAEGRWGGICQQRAAAAIAQPR